jgi:hypothetical protein
MPELEKLPQARRYLRAARFGLHTLLELKIAGTGYIFHVIGLLTTLRAVPHVLTGHDSKAFSRAQSGDRRMADTDQKFQRAPGILSHH